MMISQVNSYGVVGRLPLLAGQPRLSPQAASSHCQLTRNASQPVPPQGTGPVTSSLLTRSKLCSLNPYTAPRLLLFM